MGFLPGESPGFLSFGALAQPFAQFLAAHPLFEREWLACAQQHRLRAQIRCHIKRQEHGDGIAAQVQFAVERLRHSRRQRGDRASAGQQALAQIDHQGAAFGKKPAACVMAIIADADCQIEDLRHLTQRQVYARPRAVCHAALRTIGTKRRTRSATMSCLP